MIKTPLSTMIGGAFWTPNATIIGGASKTFDQLIKSLFANNEQGFAYDPNDMSTMFQDAVGTTPVTGAGQPVGLMLDKSKNITLIAKLNTLDVVTSVPIGGAAFTSYPIGGYSVRGRSYLVDITVSNFSGTGSVTLSGGASQWSQNPSSTTGCNISENGRILFIAHALSDSPLQLFSRSTNQCEFSNISVREISGNHAHQTTSSMRPLLAASPQRLDFDTVDDKLLTTLPAQLTGCTVIRAVPNVGTQILINQTIPTTYNDNTDHCGLIVINRALTATETSQITKLFNKAAGV